MLLFSLYWITVWSLVNIRFRRQINGSSFLSNMGKNFYAIKMTRPWILKHKQLLISILNTSVYFLFSYCLVLGQYSISNANKWLLLVPTLSRHGNFFYDNKIGRPWILKHKKLLMIILNTTVYFLFSYCLVLGQYSISNASKWLLLLVPTWENFLCYRNDQTVNFKAQTATNKHFKYFCLLFFYLLFGPWWIFGFKCK